MEKKWENVSPNNILCRNAWFDQKSIFSQNKFFMKTVSEPNPTTWSREKPPCSTDADLCQAAWEQEVVAAVLSCQALEKFVELSSPSLHL